MKEKNSGLGISGVLLIVFIILKLCKIISWSWLWVLSPLWICIGLYFLVYFIIWLIFKL